MPSHQALLYRGQYCVQRNYGGIQSLDFINPIYLRWKFPILNNVLCLNKDTSVKRVIGVKINKRSSKKSQIVLQASRSLSVIKVTRKPLSNLGLGWRTARRILLTFDPWEVCHVKWGHILLVTRRLFVTALCCVYSHLWHITMRRVTMNVFKIKKKHVEKKPYVGGYQDTKFDVWDGLLTCNSVWLAIDCWQVWAAAHLRCCWESWEQCEDWESVCNESG